MGEDGRVDSRPSEFLHNVVCRVSTNDRKIPTSFHARVDRIPAHAPSFRSDCLPPHTFVTPRGDRPMASLLCRVSAAALAEFAPRDRAARPGSSARAPPSRRAPRRRPNPLPTPTPCPTTSGRSTRQPLPPRRSGTKSRSRRLSRLGSGRAHRPAGWWSSWRAAPGSTARTSPASSPISRSCPRTWTTRRSTRCATTRARRASRAPRGRRVRPRVEESVKRALPETFREHAGADAGVDAVLVVNIRTSRRGARRSARSPAPPPSRGAARCCSCTARSNETANTRPRKRHIRREPERPKQEWGYRDIEDVVAGGARRVQRRGDRAHAGE